MMPIHRISTRALLLAGLLMGSACSRAAAPQTPVTPAPAETPIPVTHLQADFATLYAQLQASHYDLYARRSKPEYDALFATVRDQLDTPLPPTEAQLRFTRFVAYGRVAHARIDLPFDRWSAYRQAGGKALPISLRVDGGQVLVLWELGGAEGISPGDVVLAIDGQPALAWLQRLGTLVSADTDYMLHAQMEGLLPLLGWLELGAVDGAQLTLATATGATRQAWLPARTRAEVEAFQTTQDQGADTDMQSRESRMPDSGIAYLRPGPFYDNRPEASSPFDRSEFRAFVDQAFEEFLDAGATHLLVDLRDNPGGDNSFSDLMVAWFANRPFRFSPTFDIRISQATVAANQARLDSAPADAGGASADLAALYEGKAPGSHVSYPIPLVEPREGKRFQGCLHVLVNRHSYSNAVSVAAIVQDYGFGRVLGEETSDLASTYGAMEQFTLPNTGLTVGYPKARMLRPNGSPEARGVRPDVVLPRPVVEGAGDLVLLSALEEIGGQSGTDCRPAN